MPRFQILFSSLLVLFSFGPTAFAEEPTHGVLTVVKGDVKVQSGKDKSLAPAKIGQKVFPKDVIITGPDSRAKVVMVDKNVLNISPDTKLAIESYEFKPGEDKKNVVLNVLGGKVRAAVEQQYDGDENKFIVKTPTAVAGVRGTDFMASYSGTTKTSQVVTFTGQVVVGSGMDKHGNIQNPVTVNAGQSTSSGAGVPPTPAVKVNAKDLATMDKGSSAETGPKGTDQGQNGGGNSGGKQGAATGGANGSASNSNSNSNSGTGSGSASGGNANSNSATSANSGSGANASGGTASANSGTSASGNANATGGSTGSPAVAGSGTAGPAAGAGSANGPGAANTTGPAAVAGGAIGGSPAATVGAAPGPAGMAGPGIGASAGPVVNSPPAAMPAAGFATATAPAGPMAGGSMGLSNQDLNNEQPAAPAANMPSSRAPASTGGPTVTPAPTPAGGGAPGTAPNGPIAGGNPVPNLPNIPVLPIAPYVPPVVPPDIITTGKNSNVTVTIRGH